MQKHWILTAALAFGCSASDNKTEDKSTAKPPAKMKKLSKEDLQKAVSAKKTAICKKNGKAVNCTSEVGLVPPPAEMQKALANAGIQEKLSQSVTSCNRANFGANKDRAAVVTGVMMADLALTLDSKAKTIENKDEKIVCLNKMKEGFTLLGAGQDIPDTIDELINMIQNGTSSPGEMLKDFDELALILVPELTYEAGEWVVPLIQAGSWLEGSNLVSKAITKAGKADTAGHLMQQPHVADYFLRYVKQTGPNKTSDTVNQKLVATLTQLKTIASKDKITADDMKTISASTDDVLSVLHN